MDQALLVSASSASSMPGRSSSTSRSTRTRSGFYIVNQHWRDALDMICRRNGTDLRGRGGLHPHHERGPDDGRGEPAARRHAGPRTASDAGNQGCPDLGGLFQHKCLETSGLRISWNFFRNKGGKEPTLTGYERRESTRGHHLLASHPPSQRVQPAVRRPTGASLDKFIGIIIPPALRSPTSDALVKFFGRTPWGKLSPALRRCEGRKEGRIQVERHLY